MDAASDPQHGPAGEEGSDHQRQPRDSDRGQGDGRIGGWIGQRGETVLEHGATVDRAQEQPDREPGDRSDHHRHQVSTDGRGAGGRPGQALAPQGQQLNTETFEDGVLTTGRQTNWRVNRNGRSFNSHFHWTEQSSNFDVPLGILSRNYTPDAEGLHGFMEYHWWPEN